MNVVVNTQDINPGGDAAPHKSNAHLAWKRVVGIAEVNYERAPA